MAGGTDDSRESGGDGLGARVRHLLTTARTDLSETDSRVQQLEDAEQRTIERHSLGNRVSHWVQVVLFVAMLWTGLAIWTGNYFPFTLLDSGIWGGYYIAFGIHMWAAILTLGVTFVVFPYYYVVVDDHRQLLEIADIQVGVAISEAFVGLRKYIPYYHDARRAYDEDETDWMAHHPMQKTFFWWFTIFMTVIALTGFGMYAEMTTEPTWWITALGFLSAWVGFELMKQIHLVLAFVLTSMVVFHIYFAVLPGNWDILKSMVFGDLKAYVVHGDADEEPTAAADGGRESDGKRGEPVDD